MSTEIVPSPSPASEAPTALRAIAAALALIDDLSDAAITLIIQPHGDEAARIRLIDAVGRTVLGKTGQPQEMSSGACHYHVDGMVGPVDVRSYARITT
jgi:hypothetical protein